MQILLDLKTKSGKSLELYIQFFYTFIIKYFKHNCYLKNSPKQTTKYFSSVLKAPFVYKEAQEHIGFNFYKVLLKISSIKKSIFICILKKLNLFLFSDIFTKCIFLLKISYPIMLASKILKANNYTLLARSNDSYLQIFDLSGENTLKNFKSS